MPAMQRPQLVRSSTSPAGLTKPCEAVEPRPSREQTLKQAAQRFEVPPGFDFAASTQANYGLPPGRGVQLGPLADLRKALDASYHGVYAAPRQHVQDQLVLAAVERGSPQKHPWLIYTAGAMGAGKSRTMQWMQRRGFLPLDEVVHLDADLFKVALPEWPGYLEAEPLLAGALTRRESGYLVELAQELALRQGKHVWVDGSMRNGDWYEDEFKRLRRDFPLYRIAILYVRARPDVVVARARQRARETGRAVPEIEVRDSLARVPRSVEQLSPLVDFLAVIENSGDQPALRKFCDAEACYLREECWNEIERRFRSVPAHDLRSRSAGPKSRTASRLAVDAALEVTRRSSKESTPLASPTQSSSPEPAPDVHACAFLLGRPAGTR